MSEQQYLDTWSIREKVGKLSLLQRLQLALMKTEHTLISGLDPTKLALFVDISHWQGDVDFQRMVTDGRVKMMSCKASDGEQVVAGDPTVVRNYIDDWLYRNVQKAYDAHVPCMPYHYCQLAMPNYTVPGLADWNFRVFKEAMDPLVPKKSYHALCLDVEEMNATDAGGSDVVLRVIDKIAQDPKMSQVPLVIYTSMSVLNRYTKLREQLSYPGRNANLWLAQWVFTATQTISWEYFWNTIVPSINMKVITPGYASWWATQFAACFALPGGTGRTDVNFACRTPEAFWSWLGYVAAETPPPDPDPDPEPPPSGDFAPLADFLALKADYEAFKANVKAA